MSGACMTGAYAYMGWDGADAARVTSGRCGRGESTCRGESAYRGEWRDGLWCGRVGVVLPRGCASSGDSACVVAAEWWRGMTTWVEDGCPEDAKDATDSGSSDEPRLRCDDTDAGDNALCRACSMLSRATVNARSCATGSATALLSASMYAPMGCSTYGTGAYCVGGAYTSCWCDVAGAGWNKAAAVLAS